MSKLAYGEYRKLLAVVGESAFTYVREDLGYYTGSDFTEGQFKAKTDGCNVHKYNADCQAWFMSCQ